MSERAAIECAENSKKATESLRSYNIDVRNRILAEFISELTKKENIEIILKNNKKDIEQAEVKNKGTAFIDRLRLTETRISAMAEGVRQIISLPDPLGDIEAKKLANGLLLKKRRVAFGVICIIYEARPNVTVDAVALCIKSGNIPLLKGGSDAINSNKAIYQILVKAIKNLKCDEKIIGFLESTNRDDVTTLLSQDKYIDLVIPRGGETLKKFVLENAKMPVLASAGGNCHTYVDEVFDEEKIINVVINAKTQRPSTCNALEHILLKEDISEDFIKKLVTTLIENNVEVLGDKNIHKLIPSVKLATENDYTTEFLTNKVTVSFVKDVLDAVKVINKNSTGHSEAILSKKKENIEYFVNNVDSAAVYVNASTRFTDGFEFGLGAEMGISTQKLHARGPIGLVELTTSKYILEGDGEVRK